MSKGWTFWVSITLLTGLVIFLSAYVLLIKPASKIAYVRSFDLVNKYKGTIEARSAFEGKKAALQSNVDSLKYNLEKLKMNFVSSLSTLSQTQKIQQQEYIQKQIEQFSQYESAVNSRMQEEDTKMMDAVLGQINSFVEAYARENGYNIVLGTTLSGSLLYGDDQLDITDQVLAKINSKYEGM